ncbi:prolyl aminopeptidase [Denitrobaculum tricleocarpae]|uniref:Proline iminopeptidase n=1 Tax=Denitrobaculum tricleocarpae TaxID=2591009 RepID=A0A545TQZ0_9PROT|nr:prolyl aminopeptidase [Denitrobaculum tricleocarpae]TQV79634.1 prolyl aminopeptidase [Denitrobaculum tricleocarpae]
MSGLFPSIAVRESGYLAVDDLHELYWETCGNPNGTPVVFLHGGPGAGAAPDHRRFFDPADYRIVVFDQRGAGRSRPQGELRNNSTQHLIADLEALRTELGIERWVVFGGSWGSTLALAYAQAHPLAVRGLILRGIFLGRRSEIEWFLNGMRMIFPEEWARFSNFLPAEERGDLLANYHRRLIDPDPAVHLPAARVWSTFEGCCSTLLPNPGKQTPFGEDAMALNLARIEAHYFVNSIFLPKDALLDNLDRIRTIPAVIVQGRYDVVCPIVTAYELHQAWPEADYIVVPDAGHSAMEPGIRKALIAATERFKTLT